MPGLVIGAFALFTGAVAYTIWKWDELPAAFTEGIEVMTTTMALFIAGPLAGFAAAWAWNLGDIRGTVKKIFDLLPIDIQESLEDIKYIMDSMWEYIVAAFRLDMDDMRRISDEVWISIKERIGERLREIKTAIGDAWNWIKEIFSFTFPDWLGGSSINLPIHDVSLPGFAHGGMIPEPTLLTSLRTGLPYATAGERGPERVSPVGAGGGDVIVSGNTFIVRHDADIDLIATALLRKYNRKRAAMGL